MRVEFAEEDQDEESGGGEDREKDMEELEKEMVLDGEVMASWVEGIGGQGGGKGRRNDVVQGVYRFIPFRLVWMPSASCGIRVVVLLSMSNLVFSSFILFYFFFHFKA